MKVSVIIPTMKGREEMLARLLSTIPDEYEKIVVDDEDLLLAGKRNKGARKATGEYLLFIDDDNYLKDGAISNMVEGFREWHGVVGAQACYSDKKMKIADGGSLRSMTTGFTFGLRTNNRWWSQTWLETDFTRYEVHEVANAFMIPRAIFQDAGGFDEVNFPIDLDEADLCRRIKNMGYRIVMNPLAVCYHESQTYSHIPNFRRPMNAYFMGRNRIIYQRKHLAPISYWVFVAIFCPVFVCFYTASLLWKRNPKMIPHFLKGVFDGLLGRRENQYQPKQM